MNSGEKDQKDTFNGMVSRSSLENDDDDNDDQLLSVRDLQTVFYTDKEEIHAVDGVSFEVQTGETVGIVGESGSGKSVTARSIIGLIENPGVITDGTSIRFKGKELTNLTEKEYHGLRGGEIAMIFQDPLTSLNPVYTVGNQIREALRLHQGMRGQEARKEAINLLEDVGIPDAVGRVSEFPHQFSGGMRQRAIIAMALACEPDLLICDEPTTALDVTIQAQILDLLKELQEERDLGMIFITHDMGVIAQIADRVNVMYAGNVVETAPVKELFENPAHPYTRGLLQSIPSRNPGSDRLPTIEGEVPTPTEPATDCRFSDRCPEVFETCRELKPEAVEPWEGTEYHTASCLLYPEKYNRDQAIEHHRFTEENGQLSEEFDGGST